RTASACARTAAGRAAAGPASSPARPSWPRCPGRRPATGRGARTLPPRRSRPSRTCIGPAPQAPGAREWSCGDSSGLGVVAAVVHKLGRRDVRGAYPVAVRDGREALHGRAEQPPEGFGLGLAELRVLLGDSRHRAMMLTELVSPASGRGTARGG